MDSDALASIYIVDDDAELAASLGRLFSREGYSATACTSPGELARCYSKRGPVCILSDVMLGPVHGFEAAADFRRLDPACAIIFMTAWPATADAVDAIRRHGGVDYLEKPLDVPRLLASAREAVQWSARRRCAEQRLEGLSARERQVLTLIAQGKSTKVIAAELSVSPKTIEDHRASIRSKTGASNLQQLIDLLR